MIRFRGGPADEQVLMLTRAPLLLRVTQSPAGEFDALDQLYDTPNPDEKLFAYRRVGDAGTCHLKMGGKAKKGSGWYATAEYTFYEPQPEDDTMRSLDPWRTWAAHAAKSLPTES